MMKMPDIEKIASKYEDARLRLHKLVAEAGHAGTCKKIHTLTVPHSLVMHCERI